MRENQKTQDSTCVLQYFHFFTKSQILSYGRYAHSGIRVRPKTRKKNMFAKKGISVKNSSLKHSKCDFAEKSKNRWILHLTNGFRMLYPLQIQPNIPNYVNIT